MEPVEDSVNLLTVKGISRKFKRKCPKRERKMSNEETAKLYVIVEDFTKLYHATKEPVGQKQFLSKMKTCAVRRRKTLDQIKSKDQLAVIKAVPKDTRFQQTEPVGPRYTKSASILPHSILGSLSNYIDEAIRQRKMKKGFLVPLTSSNSDHRLEVHKYKRLNSEQLERIPVAIDIQTSSLLRQRRSDDSELQNTSDVVTLTQPCSDGHLSHLALSAERDTSDENLLTTGAERNSHDETSILNQSEASFDNTNDVVSGILKLNRRMSLQYEHLNENLSTSEKMVGNQRRFERQNTSQSIAGLHSQPFSTNVTDPYQGDFLGSDVTKKPPPIPTVKLDIGWGNITHHRPKPEADDRKPLSKFLNFIAKPNVGPSIKINGTSAKWNGSSCDRKDTNGLIVAMAFETRVKVCATCSILIENDGTTVIFFEWVKMPKLASFEYIKPDRTLRFYFDSRDGVIYPGEKLNFLFTFKSPNCGIFTETWKLNTRPFLMGGASILFVLRGVVAFDEERKRRRKQIEKTITSKATALMARKLIDDIAQSVRSSPRSPSPPTLYKNEKELFQLHNPKLHYHYEDVEILKDMHEQLLHRQQCKHKQWNLSMDELQSCVNSVKNTTEQQEFQHKLNTSTDRLSLRSTALHEDYRYLAWLRILQLTIDKIVLCFMRLRSKLGIPELEMIEMPVMSSARGSCLSAITTSTGSRSGSSNYSTMRQPSGRQGKSRKSARSDSKEKKTRGKDVGELQKKTSQAKRSGKKSISPILSISLDAEQKITLAPVIPIIIESPPIPDPLDGVTFNDYLSKVYPQVYSILCEMVDTMVLVFEDGT